jgi:U4/U6 small nuclear ribonucleoprotein PRP3
VKVNPYASSSTAAKDSGFEGTPKERSGRNFRFNPKGKYIQLGNQARQEAQLEALKQRIAESARKAGLDSEFETLEKNIKVHSEPLSLFTPDHGLPACTSSNCGVVGCSSTAE